MASAGAHAEKYADEAMRHLRKAVALGFSDAKRLSEEAKFAPLRAREDYQALVRGLR